MRLLALRLRDFRNVAAADLEPGPRATVIVGPNGQGKTNLLEAIYFLATLKPLRSARLAELARFGTKSCSVEGDFQLGAVRRVIGVRVEEGVRQALVDGKKVRDLEDYFGGVAVVAFTPDDLAVVKGGPEIRRRFLDRAVFNRFPAFLGESRSYGRALRSRNRLLREQAPPEVIQAFDGPLAAAGARIVTRRRHLLAELHPRFDEALAQLSAGQLEGRLRYAPQVLEGAETEAELAERLLDELERRLERDRQRGHTSVGPHADRLSIQLQGRPARTYASQGQQRAVVLALKIAEIENLRASLGHTPLLLLDDVSSELDRQRNAQLMEYLRELDGQVILSTTDPSLVAAAAGPDARYYRVHEGVFEALPDGVPADARNG